MNKKKYPICEVYFIMDLDWSISYFIFHFKIKMVLGWRCPKAEPNLTKGKEITQTKLLLDLGTVHFTIKMIHLDRDDIGVLLDLKL